MGRLSEAIKEYFKSLIEQGKQEVEITEANAEIQKIIKDHEQNNGWIPIEEGCPSDGRYVLLSFKNFSLSVVGRYEEDEEGGGNFYAGDEDIPLIKQDMYVNAGENFRKDMRGNMKQSDKVPAVWKEDKELGIAYFCSICHRFVCSNMKCDCGADIDLSLPKEHYTGKVKWENYTR